MMGDMGTKTPLAFIPTATVDVPRHVSALAGTDTIEAVWVNAEGGTTYRLGAGTARDRFVKYAPAGTADTGFAAEAQRLQWAARHARVPRVLGLGSGGSGSWMVTAALGGESAVAPAWLARPEQAAAGLGAGLRALHDALPVETCPFSWSVQDRIRDFEANIAAGASPADWSPEHARLSIGDVRRRLGNPPQPVDLVVCHGDACAPNTLLDAEGNPAAHVDLGSLGVADRWADLAVAAWSTQWNYGPGYEHHLYAGYGIEPDGEKIAYYKLLWDVT